MTLHLTSCRRTDYPASEIADLARLMDSDEIRISERYWDDGGRQRWRAKEDMSARQSATIIAALRAFA